MAVTPLASPPALALQTYMHTHIHTYIHTSLSGSRSGLLRVSVHALSGALLAKMALHDTAHMAAAPLQEATVRNLPAAAAPLPKATVAAGPVPMATLQKLPVPTPPVQVRPAEGAHPPSSCRSASGVAQGRLFKVDPAYAFREERQAEKDPSHCLNRHPLRPRCLLRQLHPCRIRH